MLSLNECERQKNILKCPKGESEWFEELSMSSRVECQLIFKPFHFFESIFFYNMTFSNSSIEFQFTSWFDHIENQIDPDPIV